ncbi:nucleotide exchange factor GrpE [Natribacillus halophilus]|uniref:Protein GrpE n=1 Tax=Natribacillus halophilus TaxID=549003 RepID=A0A1G8JV16_9BACI|nr:nucleotide exchange factor GrpE [Natribacillus halophilus]SDI34440.1 molecular chaperone GrpE [Natribacillus halophilus]
MSEKANEQHSDEEAEIIEPEAEDSPSASTEENEDVSEHEEELQKLQAELEEWKGKAKRVQADYDNFRKRTRAEKETATQFRSQSLMEALLPVLDSFKRAFASDTGEAEDLYKGMEMVHRQFVEALESEGLEEIKTEGEIFDPNVHQAVMQVEEEGFESNQIVEELQRGYKLNSRVIRPAMVKVNA